MTEGGVITEGVGEERGDGEVDEWGSEVTEEVASRGNVLDGVKKEVGRGVGGEEG